MTRLSRPRTGLFLLVSALLISCAVAFSRASVPRGEPAPVAPARAPRPQQAVALLYAVRREEARLGAAGRRFVSAFLRFEVGDLSSQVRASLRASATSGFARELEAAPPRPVGRRSPATARIERLDISFLSGSAGRALLSGVARRPDGPEEFSFLFARRGHRWQAVGAAE